MNPHFVSRKSLGLLNALREAKFNELAENQPEILARHVSSKASPRFRKPPS
jgi:hypothetical protein